MKALRLTSIVAAALPFAVLFVFGIVAAFARIPGVLLVAVILGAPLVSYATGLAYHLRTDRPRHKVALGAQTVGLAALVAGVAWGLATADPDDAGVFTPDIVLIGVSYLCMTAGALALVSRDERASMQGDDQSLNQNSTR
jgi:hypothetical protein